MMLFFDSYIDTKEKRYHAVKIITLIVCIAIVICYLTLSIHLLALHSYDALYALLKQPIVEYTYVSRIILYGMSRTTFTFGDIVYLLYSTMRWYEGIALVCIFLNLPYILHKKITMFVLFLILFEILGISIFVFIGIRATTLLGAIFALRCIGGMIGFINIILLLIYLYYLKYHMVAYKNALQYEAIEIKEHTT